MLLSQNQQFKELCADSTIDFYTPDLDFRVAANDLIYLKPSAV